LRLVSNTNKAGWWTRPRLAAVIPALAFSLSGLLLSGCYNGKLDLAEGGEINSFLDPTEPNIRPLYSAPLVKPILDTLDPASEEPEDIFSNATDVQPEDLDPAQGDYRIGRNDLVDVTVYDLLGEGTGASVKTVRVSETGYISLDFVKPIYAIGYTEGELQDVISQAYKAEGQLNNARVTVTVAEERARVFSMYGNVGSPGQYQILQNDFRMLDALIASKSPAQTEGVDFLYVIRQPEEPHHAPPPPATEPSDQTGPDQSAPSPANTPTTQLLAPPGARGNPAPGEPSLLDSNGTSAAPTQPSTPLLTPDNTAPPTGLVEGQAVPLQPAPASNSPAANGPGTVEAPTTLIGPNATQESTTQEASTEPSGGPSGLGGFKFNAPSPYAQRVIRVPLKELRAGHLQYNIVIHPGDLIYIPDPVSGEFYMGGHVARAGVYSLTARKIDLKQALISAGMFDQAAIPGRSEIIRRVGPNKEVFVRIDLDKVYAGLQPDIYLKPYDVVYVGTNYLAPFIAALRNAFRVSYGFGFTYDINYAPNNGNVNP
jgi:protein involved in polysaccharide export with SLBB domain